MRNARFGLLLATIPPPPHWIVPCLCCCSVFWEFLAKGSLEALQNYFTKFLLTHRNQSDFWFQIELNIIFFFVKFIYKCLSTDLSFDSIEWIVLFGQWSWKIIACFSVNLSFYKHKSRRQGLRLNKTNILSRKGCLFISSFIIPFSK